MATNFYFSSNNSPDAKIILNRGTEFQYDISNDVRSFNCTNDIDTPLGNFTIVVDNTNDKHVDRFGVPDTTVMSSVEIFVKTNIANTNKAPNPSDALPVTTREGESVNTLIENKYGLSSYTPVGSAPAESYRQRYLRDIVAVNLRKTFRFKDGKEILIRPTTDASTFADDELSPGNLIKMPAIYTDYKKIFLGVVTNVQQSFSAGSEMTISLTGESIGYWLRASTVNIRPGLNETGNGASTSTQLTNYANKYADSKALDIFRELISASSNDTLTVSDYTYGTTYTSYEAESAEGDILTQQINDQLGNSFKVAGKKDKSLTLKDAFDKARNPKIDTGEIKTLTDVSVALDSLKDSIRNGTYIDGTEIAGVTLPENTGETDSVESQFDQYVKASQDYAQSERDFQTLKTTEAANIVAQKNIFNKGTPAEKTEAQTEIDASEKKVSDAAAALKAKKTKLDSNDIMKQQLNTIDKIQGDINKQITESGATGKRVLEQLGIMKHWKQIFSKIVLEVANAAYLQNVYPFKWIVQGPDIMDGDYQPKSNIAKLIADALNFEFYMDTNGHFVLKPPLYNIGIPDDDSTYIIEQEDLVSFNINDTVDGMITRVGVTGDFLLPVQLERLMTYNAHTDFNLLNKYGVHNVELQNLIFLRTPQDCKDFGESYMAKNNQNLRNATITIMGRPDIRLGVAVYLKPRDTVYYIKGIAHDFQAGGQYTTTLTLIGARKIVLGYLTNSFVTTMTTKVIDGITIRSSSNDDLAQTITHFVLANSLSPSVLTASVEEINQLGNEAKPPTIDSAETQKFSVVRNSYIIVSHPNIAYVGFIVGENSVIRNDINYNTFKYIWNASERAITRPLQATAENLKSNFGKDLEPFTTIRNFLVEFIITNNIGNLGNSSTDDVIRFLGRDGARSKSQEKDFQDVAESFNQAILNQYIADFLNFLEIESSAAKNTSDINEVQVLNSTSSYFNEMIIEAQSLGSYRQFTDENGREFPALLDYGNGLKVENAQFSMKENTSANTAINTEAKVNDEVDRIIKAAKQNNPNINVSQSNNPIPPTE